jgi:hypothetical protein
VLRQETTQHKEALEFRWAVARRTVKVAATLGLDKIKAFRKDIHVYGPSVRLRKPGCAGLSIDALWDVFATCIKFADSEDEEARIEFIKAFDSANGRKGVAWNLTFGLYWIRPWRFLSLDHNSKVYVSKKLAITIGLHGPKKRCSAADYLAVMDTLEARFQEASYPVHSYPELSLEAWTYKVLIGLGSRRRSAN